MNPVPFILLAISLPLLLGGCGGEKKEPVGEVKPEEPVAETKPELEGVNDDELEEREGIRYLKGSETRYTGKAFALWENGQKRYETNYKDGKPDGLGVAWHENGQMKGEVNWKDGKKEGLVVAWHENGKKKAEATYKDGEKVEGSEKFWNNKDEPVDSFEEAEKE